MDVLTTTEISEKWNISPRRIAKLASQGRIPGAKYVDNRWLIPFDAKKPCDARCRRAKTGETDCYFFPYVPASICFEHTPDMLNEEEKLLYDACVKYENGDFAESIRAAVKLMESTSNSYTRIGCLYVLIFCNILLHRFEEASQSIFHYFSACRQEEDRQHDIYLFMNETRSFFYDKNWFLTDFYITPGSSYSSFTSAYLSTLCALQDLVKAGSESSHFNANLHELKLSDMEKCGYAYFSMLYHYYLSMLYAGKNNASLEYTHLKKAFDIAIENRLYASLAGYLYVLPDRAYAILAEYPETVQNKFSHLIELSASSYADYCDYAGSSTRLNNLSKEDYILIAYCLRNYTLEKIAELESISLSKAKRKLVALYKKVGVKGKAELCSAYSAFFNQPGPC